MLYLVRHGHTDQPMLRPPGDLTPATLDEWEQDHGLSERGREEARELGTFLARLDRPDRTLASPRRRTRETLRFALGDLPHEVDPGLHEWFADESIEALHARARELLDLADAQVVLAFTHGGFIRAVVAAVLVGADLARFGPTFHDLRRTLAVWNASVTLVGHGAGGLELFAVNACPAADRLLGRG